MLKNQHKLIQERDLLRNRVSSGVAITLNKVNATFSRNAKGLLAGAFARISLAIGLNYTAFRFRVIVFFIRRCQNLFNTQGMKGLVIHLKAVSVLFQQSLGGYVLRDCKDLKARPARTKLGLPKFIHPLDRAKIRAGDYKVMRFYMSLFALYRVLEFPGTVKLNTITDGFKGSDKYTGLYTEIFMLVPTFARMLKIVARDNGVLRLEERGISPRPIIKSAPGTGLFTDKVSTAPAVLATQAVNLKRLGLSQNIEYFIKYFTPGTPLPKYPGLLAMFQGAADLPLHLFSTMHHYIGKLGYKDEAAGKIRVFAMVDAWTQWSLEPIHQWMFDILRHIPMDGTFDQMKPVRAKARTATAAYSLDLTAATDRLPMDLQEKLVANLVNTEFAANWRSLLTGREYSAHSTKRGIKGTVKYGVGQPMGALSSWSSLAITHHFLVQVSAWLSGVTPRGEWFTEYAVLGDDLVIFSQPVKVHYLRVVAALGVECGTHKSLLSPRGTAIEFAKRTLVNGVDVSPISLTEFISANLRLADAIAFARANSLTFPALIKVLGYGYKVRGSLDKPIGSLNSRVRALMFAFYLPEGEGGLQSMMMKGNPHLSEKLISLVVTELSRLVRERLEPRVAALLESYPSTPEVIKKLGSELVSFMTNRFEVWYLLQLVLAKVNTTEKAVSVDVEPPVYNPLTGLSTPKGFEWSPEDFKAKEVTVPTEYFEALEHVVRNWTLVAERLVKLVVEKPMSRFRADASKLPYLVNHIKYGRDLFSAWTYTVEALKSISNIGTGKVPMERDPEEIKRVFASDPMQMRFWRDFTTAILIVLKRTKGATTSSTSTPKEPGKTGHP